LIEQVLGREKKTSLRKTGKDKKQSSAPVTAESLIRNKPTPLLNDSGNDNVVIDCGANLVNRHLEGDQTRIIQRAKQVGVEGIVIITNDFEKTENCVQLSTLYPGTVYTVAGIHPSNISSKKMSDKLFQQLITQLKTFAVNPHVVGIYSGLDYERDYGLKFPQEKFFKAQVSLAEELNLPMIIQDFGEGEGLLEVLKDCRRNISRGMIYSFNSSSSFLQKFIDMDFYISFNGIICENTDKGDQMRDFITKVPINRLLLLTESPNHTPKTIQDEFIRDSKNEPSNLTYIVQQAAKCLGMSENDLCKQLKNNAKEFYGLNEPLINTEEGGEEEKEQDQDEDDEEEEKVTTTTKKTSISTTTTPTDKKKDNKKDKKKKKSGKKQQTISSDEDQDDEDDDEEDQDEEEEETNIKNINRNISRLSEKELENIHYSCKKCRTKLFKYTDLLHHEEQSKVLDPTFVSSKKNKQEKQQQQQESKQQEGKQQQSNSSGCKSFFLKCDQWMNVESPTKNNCKVMCPKCDAKLGSFSCAGEKCSCGKVVVQSCRVLKNRVDTVLVNDNGQLVDLSMLNIDDDDESDDDIDAIGKKKKKKAAKKNIKKDNKRNLSNYRNKNESGRRNKKTTNDSDDEEDQEDDDNVVASEDDEELEQQVRQFIAEDDSESDY